MEELAEKMGNALKEIIKDEIEEKLISIYETKPNFKVKVDVPLAEIDTCINFMKKAREVFKDADLEINVRSIRYWQNS